MECLDLLLRSNSILLWGNHDLAYLRQEPWWYLGNFSELTFQRQYERARDRIFAAYAVDGWLCTHAGVSPKLTRRMPTEVLAGGVETIAAWLNHEFKRELKVKNPHTHLGESRYGYGPLFNIPVCRGGTDEFGGIFWFDAEGEQSQPSHLIRQIFGHTPGNRPQRGISIDLAGSGQSAPWINIDTLKGSWLYDTKADALVEFTI